MGSVFEELIRRFAEQSNETAGEHFTPREVIRLMVSRHHLIPKNSIFGKIVYVVETKGLSTFREFHG